MTAPKNLPLPYDPIFAMSQEGLLPPVVMLGPVYDLVVLATPPPTSGYTLDSISSLRDPVRDSLGLDRSLYYDRAGKPITMEQWGELREMGLDPDGHYGTSSYIRIGEEVVGEAKVSTVWLGIDHGWPSPFDEGPYRPVIFETMIFGGRFDNYQRRYCTEWEAIEGHGVAVADLQMGMEPWWAEGGCVDDAWHMGGRSDG